jgi:hypothetical protein
MVYGADELSTINQRRLIMARRIVTKLVVAGAMSDAPAIGPRTLTIPFDKGDSTLIQIFPGRVRARLCARAPRRWLRGPWLRLLAVCHGWASRWRPW